MPMTEAYTLRKDQMFVAPARSPSTFKRGGEACRTLIVAFTDSALTLTQQQAMRISNERLARRRERIDRGRRRCLNFIELIGL
jgi:hypothetical protein